MDTTPRSLAERLHHVDPARHPVDVAVGLLWTSDDWFEGLDPAVAWSQIWFECAGRPREVREALGRAVRAGYRHGRDLLDTSGRPHPERGNEELTDVISELLCTLTVEAATTELFDTLPPAVRDTHDALARLLADDFVLPSTLTPEQRRDVCRLGLDLGLVLAAIEQQLVPT